MICSKLGSICLLAIGLPSLPPKSPPLNPPVLQTCAGADLKVQAQQLSSQIPGWIHVCTPIRNAGGSAWSSDASQVGIAVSNSLGGSGSLGGFANLASSSTSTKCVWVSAPGLVRVGTGTPNFGECAATMTVTSKLVFDPDIATDGNTANDDCQAANNTRTVTVHYMAACPW